MTMSAAMPYGICVLALLSQFLLAVSLRQLRAGKAEIQAAVGRKRIRLVVAGLLSAPVITVAVVLGLYLFVSGDKSPMQAAHAAFSLGLWLVLVMSFFVLLLMYWMRRKPSLESLAGPVVAVALTAYLTPRLRFQWVFGEVGLILPLVVGGVMVLVNYILAWQAWRELR